MHRLPENLQKRLVKRAEANSLRVLNSKTGLIDFSSNDYLGFAQDEGIAKRSTEILESYDAGPNGSGGSRLLSGQSRLFEDLESLVAFHHNAQAALMFNSGFAANVGLLGSVPQRGDLVLYDELVHASLREGIRLNNADSYKFRHNNLDDLQQQLEKSKHSYANIYVVSETVFSMDGNGPDLNALVDLSEDYNCWLILDEAHAIGMSDKGRVVDLGLQEKVFARVITFGKAIGSHGAAVLGDHELMEYLVNFASSFIYSTAPAPHTVATVMAAYERLDSEAGQLERDKLNSNIAIIRSKISELDFSDSFLQSDTAIQSYLIPGNQNARSLSRHLEKKGFDVRAILSPTVSPGSERLRICIHSFNTVIEIDRLLKAIEEFNA